MKTKRLLLLLTLSSGLWAQLPARPTPHQPLMVTVNIDRMPPGRSTTITLPAFWWNIFIRFPFFTCR